MIDSLMTNHSTPEESPEYEPTEDTRPVPVGFHFVFFLLCFLAMLYLDSQAGGFNGKVYEPFASYEIVQDIQPQLNVDPRFEKGRLAYMTYCFACHQADGRGLFGSYPPLAGSDWVNDEKPERMLRVIMNGLTGPITVSGESWNVSAQMPAFGMAIPDNEELAALVTFVRGQKDWGNEASPVTAEEVEAIRNATLARGIVPWTEEALREVMEP